MIKEYNATNEVNYILSQDINNIVKSQDSLRLLAFYSKIYLYGCTPRWCERSQRIYYAEIQQTGKFKAMEFDEIKNRVCKPNFKNNKFCVVSGKGAIHVHPDYLTDKKAIQLLADGFLQESDFEVLPYVKEEIKEEVKEHIKVVKKRK